MVEMSRGEFKAYMCNVVNHCDDASFKGLSELFLTACGVIDRDGNLTEKYASSPYWSGGTDGEPLCVSDAAKDVQAMLGGVS